MALTVTVTLDDSDVQRFIDLYNEDAGTDITIDMLNQNPELQEAIASDMASFWFDALEDEEHASAYDLYSDSLDPEEVFTNPSDIEDGMDGY